VEGAKLNSAKRVLILTLILAVSALMIPVLSCTRYKDLPRTGDAISGLQPPPFGRLADTAGVSPTAAFLPAFVAAGTSLTVRLQTSMSSAYSHAGDSFQAVLETPVVLQGETVVPQGTPITGKISAVSVGGHRGAPGYLRLSLTAISLNGKSLALQTSTVFAKAGPRVKPRPSTPRTSQETPKAVDKTSAAQQDVEFTPQSNLTFRLARPLWLGG